MVMLLRLFFELVVVVEVFGILFVFVVVIFMKFNGMLN